MEVKLTKTGLDLFGFGLDRSIINVNLDRAYRLMAGGYANKDKPFIALYETNHLVESGWQDQHSSSNIIIWKPDPDFGPPREIMVMKKPKKKREKAVSKKAAKREKAVKP